MDYRPFRYASRTMDRLRVKWFASSFEQAMSGKRNGSNHSDGFAVLRPFRYASQTRRFIGQLFYDIFWHTIERVSKMEEIILS
jgi:hypothetical protein